MRILAGLTFRCLAYGPDGRHLATGHDGGTVRVWDAATGSEVARTSDAGSEPIVGLMFHPDGSALAAGTGSRFHHWDLARTGTGLTLKPVSRSFHPLPTADLVIRIDWRRMHYCPGGDVFLGHMLWAPTLVFIGHAPVRLWDYPLPGTTPLLRAEAIDPGGRFIAVSGDDDPVRVWDLSVVRERREAGPVVELPDSGPAPDLCFMPDGSALVGVINKSVRVWDVSTWECRLRVNASKRRLHCCAVSPDGVRIAVGGRDGEIVVLDSAGGEKARLDFGIGEVMSVAFSPDGLTAAAIGRSHKLAIWDVE